MRRLSIAGIGLLSLLAGGAAVWWGLSKPDSPGGVVRSPGTIEQGAIVVLPAPEAPPLPVEGRCKIEVSLRRGDEPAAALVRIWHVDGDSSASTVSREPELLPAWATAPAAFEARAAADGRAAFTNLAIGRWHVEATDPGFRTARVVELRVDGEQADVFLDLQSASLRLEARILRSDGMPFVGAVALRARDRVERPTPSTADSDGRVRAEGFSRGEYDVRVVDGTTLWTLGSISAGDAPVPLRIPEAARTVTGRVTEASTGRPIRGARLYADAGPMLGSSGLGEYVDEYSEKLLAAAIARNGGVRFADEDGGPANPGGYFEGNQAEILRAQTDETGTFRIAVPAGVEGLRVVAEGFEPQVRSCANAPQGFALLHRRSACRVHGRVVDAGSGVPVPGVSIYRLPLSGRDEVAEDLDVELDVEQLLRERVWLARSDADGRYDGRSDAPLDGVLVAYGNGWVSDELDALRSDSNPFAATFACAGDLEVDLRVVRTARLEGRVVDSDGRAVTGAVVAAYDSDLGVDVCEPTTTAADGSFALAGPFLGRKIMLRAERDGATTESPQALSPSAPVTGGIAITFRPRRLVRVRATYAESKEPVSRAHVRIGSHVGTTDIDGEARLELPDDDTDSVEVVKGLASASADLAAFRSLAPGARESAVEVSLEGSAIRPLSGRVRFPDGTPASSALIQIGSILGVDTRGPSDASGLGAGSVREETRCDAEGRFRLLDVREGPHQLYATPSGLGDYATTRMIVDREREGIEVVLDAPDARPVEPSPPALVLRVLQPDGRPVSRARAELVTPMSKNHSRKVTAGVVRFLRPHVRFPPRWPASDAEEDVEWHPTPFPAWVRIWRAEAESGLPLPLGVEWFLVRPSQASPIEIRLKPERVIEGTVVDKAGLGIGGIWVRARDLSREARSARVSPRSGGEWEPTWEERVVISRARTDSEGRFRLGGLGDRDYAIIAVPPTGFRPPEVHAVPGGTTGLRIQLLRWD